MECVLGRISQQRGFDCPELGGRLGSRFFIGCRIRLWCIWKRPSGCLGGGGDVVGFDYFDEICFFDHGDGVEEVLPSQVR